MACWAFTLGIHHPHTTHNSPSFPHSFLCIQFLSLSSTPLPIPKDRGLAQALRTSIHSLLDWKGPSGTGQGGVVGTERTGIQETWVPVPALSLLHSVALNKSLPLNRTQFPYPPNESRGYLKVLLAPKHSMSVSWPTASNSVQVTTGGSPVTQLLKRHWHDHINGFYCGEGQGLLQKTADLNRAQGASWQHCSQAARGREEKQPVCVCSCHISEQHSNLVNIILLTTKSHR